MATWLPVPLAFGLSIAILLAGCSAPTEAGLMATPAVGPAGDDGIGRESVTGTPGQVGGAVKNSAPTFLAVSQSATTGENRGAFVVVFSGQVRDANTEAQFKNISIRATGPTALAFSHEILPTDLTGTTEPAFGPDGWKVWTGERADGVLNFAYRQPFPALMTPGVYVFTLRVEDQPGAFGLSNALTVTLTAFSDITISPLPVDATGTVLVGQNWGQWEAEANASNVESTNFIKLVNTGDVPASRVVIDFADAFVGAEDTNWTIPVADKVQFAWFEDTTPLTTAPSEGTFAYEPANADGSVTLAFTGKGNVIYVKYQIVKLPELLPVQSYGISFTVTEL